MSGKTDKTDKAEKHDKAEKRARAQAIDLLVSLAASLGITTDRELGELCDVSPDNIAHWKSGATQELKPQTLALIKERLAARLSALRQRAGDIDAAQTRGLVALEVEEGSGPAALQRQLAERVRYDYLGHRFLYFEPQGALAWESLMRHGYDQRSWLDGVNECAESWLHGDGPLARALGLSGRGSIKGLDVISLGPGEAGKEAILLRHIRDVTHAKSVPFLSCALVDVSIPLLLTAATACREVWRDAAHASVLPICGDFEEGQLGFLDRLPTTHRSGVGTRLVLMLGNVFGNVRDEEKLVQERLSRMLRPGDFLWLEVALRFEHIENDPLFRMTQARDDELSAPEAARRMLLEGPFRRFEAAAGRRTSEISTKIWVRQDDETSKVPGSCNFCHDLVIKDERRAFTMLYSRRYALDGLKAFLQSNGFSIEGVTPVEDSVKRARVAHVLARRT